VELSKEKEGVEIRSLSPARNSLRTLGFGVQTLQSPTSLVDADAIQAPGQWRDLSVLAVVDVILIENNEQEKISDSVERSEKGKGL
jgi:hypothetical protein